jgi:TRAP-type transport system large permease protein
MVVAVSFTIMIGLMLVNVPIAVCTGLAAIGAIIVSSGVPVMVAVQRIYVGMDSFTLIAVPLFILTGRFMAVGGITGDLISLSRVMVGRLRGGLAYINIVSSMFFAGITGSATSDTASVGGILIPTMIDKDYDKDFSVAVTATSSTIGVLIPPSIPMVVYGVASGASIAKLFLGGMIPGILVGLALMAVTFFIARKRNYPVEQKIPAREATVIVLKSIPALMTIIIILGGIISGFFTPTEAAGIAALYSFVLGFLYYRELKLSHLGDIFLDVAVTTGMVAIMIGTASSLGWIFASQGVPAMLAKIILGTTANKIVILLMINALLLFVGTWLDLSPAVIIFTPILLPIVTALGIDPVHFGVIMIMNLAIGLFTPPVGVCLFVSCGIAGISISESIKAFIPFFLAMVVVLLIVTYIPSIVVFFPNMLGR